VATINFLNEDVVSGAWNDEQRAAVLEELNLILADPAFKSSNRCSDMLRYLVQRALTDGAFEIRERTLGYEVFGRSADYDLGADNIVRRIAGEIRKRLAQYYHEHDISHRVTIHLHRGSYLPVFEFHTEEPPRALTSMWRNDPSCEPANPQAMASQQLPNSDSKVSADSRKWVIGAVAAVLLCCACVPLMRVSAVHSRLYTVWRPLLDSGEVVTIYFRTHDSSPKRTAQAGQQGTGMTAPSSQSGSPSETQITSPNTLALGDAYVGMKITSLLSNFKKQASLRLSTEIKPSDFQRTPTVVVGGVNTPWMRIMLSKLRYNVRYDPGSQDRWVQDGQNPSRRDWFISGKDSDSVNALDDYAVITRIFNEDTGQWVIALCGLEARGTEAAAALIADPKNEMLIPASIGERGNFQIVLKTSLINGEPGPLQVLAVETW